MINNNFKNDLEKIKNKNNIQEEINNEINKYKENNKNVFSEKLMGKKVNTKKFLYMKEIIQWTIRFEKQLDGYSINLEDIESWNLKTLENTLAQIQYLVGLQNNQNLVSPELINGILYFIELNGSKIGVNLNGLTQACMQNQEIKDIIDEAKMLYTSVSYSSPLQRLIISFLKVGSIVYFNNISLQKQQEAINKISEEDKKRLIEKYNNI